MSYFSLRFKFLKATLCGGVVHATSADIPSIVALHSYNDNIFRGNPGRDPNFMPSLYSFGEDETFFFTHRFGKLTGSITIRPLEEKTFYLATDVDDDYRTICVEGKVLSFAQISVNADQRNRGLATKLLKAAALHFRDAHDVGAMILTPLEDDGKTYLQQKPRLRDFARQLPFPVYQLSYDGFVRPV